MTPTLKPKCSLKNSHIDKRHDQAAILTGNIEKKIMMVQTNQKKAPIYICEASQED